MSITFMEQYPGLLKNSTWQKKKSFKDKAKAKTKTGLGAALDKAEAEWKGIDFSTFKLPTNRKFKSVKEINDLKTAAQTDIARGRAKSAYDELITASKKARDTASNTHLSNTAIAAANDLSKRLAAQAALIKGIKFDDFDDAVTLYQKRRAMQLNTFKTDLQQLEAGLKQVITNPTVAVWDDQVRQQFRSVGNTVGNFDEFADVWPVWQNFDGLQLDNHAGITATATAKEIKAIILKEVSIVLPHLKALKQRANT